MKKIILCLLLIFSSSTLYPLTLTKQDLKTIHTLRLTIVRLGITVGILGFIKYAYSLPFLQTDMANQADNAARQANFIRWIRPLIIDYGLMSGLIGVLPILATDYLKDIIATIYIACKYNINYRHASLAIKDAMTKK